LFIIIRIFLLLPSLKSSNTHRKNSSTKKKKYRKDKKKREREREAHCSSRLITTNKENI
jgi:hypothetical protein